MTMDVEGLERIINDPTTTDSEVFEALWEFLSEKRDASGKKVSRTPSELLEIQQLGKLTDTKRPWVMEEFAKAADDPHYFCCGPGARKVTPANH